MVSSTEFTPFPEPGCRLKDRGQDNLSSQCFEIGVMMPVLTMDLRRLYEILQSASGREHFVSRYPDLMVWYDGHVSSGFASPLVQASLKALWQQEMERDAQMFTSLSKEGPGAEQASLL